MVNGKGVKGSRGRGEKRKGIIKGLGFTIEKDSWQLEEKDQG
jgi:hypothetical protein